MFQRLNDTPSVPDGVLVVPTLSAPCALRGLGAPVRMGAPAGRASCPPCGASGRRPCRPSAIAPPRPLGAALRVGAWPCGAGVSVLKVAPAYSGAEYKPGPGDLCDLVRVSGDVRSLRSL